MNNTVNPMQIMQMIRSGQNPQQLIFSMLQNQMGGTPMGENLMFMIQNGQTGDIEKFARNIMQSRGIDFDTEFAKFKSQMGIN